VSDKNNLIKVLGRLELIAENLMYVVKKLNQQLIYANEKKKEPKLENCVENFFNSFLKDLLNKKDKQTLKEIHEKWMEKIEKSRDKNTVSIYLSKLCRAGYIKIIRDKIDGRKKIYGIMNK